MVVGLGVRQWWGWRKRARMRGGMCCCRSSRPCRGGRGLGLAELMLPGCCVIQLQVWLLARCPRRAWPHVDLGAVAGMAGVPAHTQRQQRMQGVRTGGQDHWACMGWTWLICVIRPPGHVTNAQLELQACYGNMVTNLTLASFPVTASTSLLKDF